MKTTTDLNKFFLRLEVVDYGLGVIVEDFDSFLHRRLLVVVGNGTTHLHAMAHPAQHLVVFEGVGDAAGAEADVGLEFDGLRLLARETVDEETSGAQHRLSVQREEREKGRKRRERENERNANIHRKVDL